MPDTARVQRVLTIEEIAELTRAKPRAGDPLDRRISNIAPLDTAVAADISFLDKPKFLDALAVTRAGACFISPRFEAKAPPGLVVLVTPSRIAPSSRSRARCFPMRCAHRRCSA